MSNDYRTVPMSHYTSLAIVPDEVVFVNDPQHPCWGNPGFPLWLTEFRPHQWQAFEDIVTSYRTGAKVVMLDAPVGCLSGDTIIGVNRGGKGFSLPIRDLMHRFNGGAPPGGRRWDPSIPTMVQRADDGLMRLGQVARVVDSGSKFTYTLVTEAGRKIRATAEHPFLTPSGFVELGKLTVGDVVMVNDGQNLTGAQTTRMRDQYVARMQHHPFKGNVGAKSAGRVALHRLVAEATLNNLDYDIFLKRVIEGDVEGLTFLDPAVYDVHHINHDHDDNAPSNLQVLTKAEHKAHHAEAGTWRNVQHHIGEDRITSITPFGTEVTYDITMADEPHNFIANGFVVHNSGKTIIAEMVRRWVGAQTLYVCSGKALQDQFVHDFPYAKVLKGRSNYMTADHPDGIDDLGQPVTAADCDAERMTLPGCGNCPGDAEGFDNNNADDEVLHCSECHPVAECPYRAAKATAAAASLACINTSYFLTEVNGPGTFKDRPFVIVDECDMLEKEVMSFYEVTISSRRRSQFGIKFPKHKTVKAGTRPRLDDEGHTSTEWEDWFAETIRTVKDARRRLPRRPSSRSQRKEAQFLDRLDQNLAMVKETIGNGDWVYTGYDRGEITFKPVTVRAFGDGVLWKHSPRWLLMSGTIIDPAEMVDSLGLDPSEHWEVVSVPMTFPKENRPIKILPTAEMSAKNKHEAWPKMAKRVAELADHHPNERILIHGVSYALCAYLFDSLPTDRRITYTNAQDREPALQRYLNTPAGILVAPSMDRGVDLPGDACLAAGTRVLTDRLEWVPIETLKPGHRIVGMDEEAPANRQRALRYAEVEATATRKAECYRIITTHGEITATEEHPFLVTPVGKRIISAWTTVADLKPGDRIRWITAPVEQDKSWGAGYLAGFYDGEGSVTMHTRGENNEYQAFAVCGVQKPGEVLDTVIREMTERGFTNNEYKRLNGVHELRLQGRMSERLRFLSTIRPERLITNTNLDGLTGRDGFAAEILSITPVGVQPVYNLQTSTQTYIAEGFVTHNCRVQVICKLPFPYLGDKQISTRLYSVKGGQQWYQIQCVRSFVQMTGRGVRNKDDYAITYILDNAFMNNLYKKAKRLLPKYFDEAIDWSGRL